MNKHIIITSCTKQKSTEFAPEGRSLSPSDYLANRANIARLTSTRAAIFSDPKSDYDPRSKPHYAYDLYVCGQKTQLYRKLRKAGLALPVRERLLIGTDDVDWYFISGGYGLLHALELARPYQATFDKQIANKNRIPCTLLEWKRVLPNVLDEVFERTAPCSVSVFGSKAYVKMVQDTHFYHEQRTQFYIKSGRANGRALTDAFLATVRRLFRL